jgi:hypothetical protein
MALKQHSFLGNGCETDNGMMPVARQQILTKNSKYVPAAVDTRMVSSALAVLRSYKEGNWGNQVSSVWDSVKKRVGWKGATIQVDFSTEDE